MEIIIALLVLGAAIWWFFIRDENKPEVSAPYKVEAAPVAEEAPQFIEATVELAPIAVATVTTTEAPAKKPRKPRAPKVVAAPVKVVAKKAAPKKVAAIKAAPKVRSKKV